MLSLIVSIIGYALLWNIATSADKALKKINAPASGR